MDPLKINLSIGKLPPATFFTLIQSWLRAYETARATQYNPDMLRPEILEANAAGLSASVARMADGVVAELVKPIVKMVADQSFAAGLGRPMPSYTFDAPEAKGYQHPAKAVQTVERDPITAEVIRTVTEYQG